MEEEVVFKEYAGMVDVFLLAVGSEKDEVALLKMAARDVVAVFLVLLSAVSVEALLKDSLVDGAVEA